MSLFYGLIYFVEALSSLMIVYFVYSKKDHVQLFLFSFCLFLLIMVCPKHPLNFYEDMIRFLFVFGYGLVVSQRFEISLFLVSLLSTLSLKIANSIAAVIYCLIFWNRQGVNSFIMTLISHILYVVLIYLFSLFILNSRYFNKRLMVLINVSLLIISFIYSQLIDRIFIDSYNSSAPILIVLTVLFVIIIMIFYEVQRDAKELYEKQLQVDILEEKKKNYYISQESIEQTKRLQHDLSHIYNSVIYELNHNEVDKAIHILTKQVKELDNLNKFIITGNDVIDYCIALQKQKIEEKNIHIYSDCLLDMPLENEDLFILFGNLIVNAIEHCEPHPYCQIIISAGMINDYFYLKIKNTIHHSVLKNNPYLKTSKCDKDQHGKGLKICQNVVFKYHGRISFDEDEQFFCVKVIIPR